MEQLSYTGQLLMKLNQQRSKGHLCDVIIMVENVLFRAHKNVLAACSSYFKCLVLRDNLITLNTKMVKPSVFKEVLDFIYTGQLPTVHHASNLGVSALLRAASYLQLSDLAALCRRILCKPCSSSLTTNGHLHHRSGSVEVENSTQDGLQALDLSKEELLTAQCGSVNPSAAVKINESEGKGVSEELARRSQTGSLGSSLQHSSSQSSDDVPINSTSTSYYPRLERGGPWVHKRFGCIKRQEVKEGEKMLSELEVQAEVGQEDLSPKTFPPALPDTLHLCVPCGKAFPSSEQLIAHVSSHTAEELRTKAEDADEGSLIKTGDQLPPQSLKENTKPDVTPRCYVCSVCSKSYMDVVLLRQHERIHLLSSRPFSCNICGQLFTQRGTMTRHMRSHLGLKPFACEVCGMRFTRQYRKMEHMRVHSGEKPYECHLCGVKFSQQRSIISHLKMHTVI
ncbi:Hypermethylated in cancer 2 protein [Collichthys lucidus]|uniref:Hypermethylated in cancer 2 protein n=1 Tax=Collichthys lucidus TaxID=240159 RepID=A0A4U5VAN8_COLLU|nr:Hypermethylated in cancer 2 protein [Collichthys lucidus]